MLFPWLWQSTSFERDVVGRLDRIEEKINMANADLDALAADIPPLLDQINAAVKQLAALPANDPRAAQLDQQVRAATDQIKAALAPKTTT